MMRGALPGQQLVPYWISQLTGATVAAYTACLITGQEFSPAPGAGTTTMQAFLVEALFTFALCLVVLNVATSKRTEGNSYFGLAIGFTVVVAAFAGGGISGGAFNPAVGTGPTIIHALSGDGGWANLWLYWVGPLAGGVLAALIFRFQEGPAT
jgi:aquaporin Z